MKAGKLIEFRTSLNSQVIKVSEEELEKSIDQAIGDGYIITNRYDLVGNV